VDKTIIDALDAELAWLRTARPRATSVHEAYSSVASAVHLLHDTAIRTSAPSGGLSAWKAGIRIAAIHIAALALQIIEDFHLSVKDSGERSTSDAPATELVHAWLRGCAPSVQMSVADEAALIDRIANALEQAVAAERVVCAQIAGRVMGDRTPSMIDSASWIAAQIYARGTACRDNEEHG
jgi:hypothetical protein